MITISMKQNAPKWLRRRSMLCRSRPNKISEHKHQRSKSLHTNIESTSIARSAVNPSKTECRLVFVVVFFLAYDLRPLVVSTGLEDFGEFKGLCDIFLLRSLVRKPRSSFISWSVGSSSDPLRPLLPTGEAIRTSSSIGPAPMSMSGSEGVRGGSLDPDTLGLGGREDRGEVGRRSVFMDDRSLGTNPCGTTGQSVWMPETVCSSKGRVFEVDVGRVSCSGLAHD